jgi:hypothetical protein
MIGYILSTTIFIYFSDLLWRTAGCKTPEISWAAGRPCLCVLRHLPVERPDPKLMLSPDPDRPLGTPTGKEKWLTQAPVLLFPVVKHVVIVIDILCVLVTTPAPADLLGPGVQPDNRSASC